jgi:hypothetical protein
MFTPESRVVVEQLEEAELRWKYWELRGRLEYHAKHDVFIVEPGSRTDFASVPRVFVWLLPRYGRYTRAAILHDHLWACARRGEMSYHDADGIFRQAMRRLDVPLLRRWMMWAAVRWASLVKRKPGGRRAWLREAMHWLKDAPGVLVITLVMLPIAAPPAAVIMVALGVFYVFEAITWAMLKIGRGARRLVGRPPAKQVNPPTFDWDL